MVTLELFRISTSFPIVPPPAQLKKYLPELLGWSQWYVDTSPAPLPPLWAEWGGLLEDWHEIDVRKRFTFGQPGGEVGCSHLEALFLQYPKSGEKGAVRLVWAETSKLRVELLIGKRERSNLRFVQLLLSKVGHRPPISNLQLGPSWWKTKWADEQ